MTSRRSRSAQAACGRALTALSLAAALAGLPFSGPAWAQGSGEAEIVGRLTLPPGFTINRYATGLGRARLMVMTAKGDIILSSPQTKILLVRADANGDGRADKVEVLMDGLKGPHGLWLEDGWLYVAETARVFRIRYDAEAGRVSGKPETLIPDLPDDGGHWTRTIKKGPDGWFYVSIGSSCNVCIENHPWRAAMIRFKPGGKPELFASGLRNTVGFDWQPGTGILYGVDNGRDWLGDEFPPDELNLIEKGGFYGWPYLNGDNVTDPDYGRREDRRIADARPAAFGFRAHVAPLSIRFLRHSKAPELQGAALVGQHGSWNRSTKIGYRVVSLHWGTDGRIERKVFLSGFEKDGDVVGRPVDVLEAGDGTLYVSDDSGGAIWRITYRP